MKLTSIMAAQNVSQYKLSKISGISQSSISRIERGIRQPTLPTLKKLAAALGVTVAELLDDEQAATLDQAG